MLSTRCWLVPVGPSEIPNFKPPGSISHADVTSQMCQEFSHDEEVSLQRTGNSGDPEVDRLSKCRLDAFKSLTREPEIASRA